MAKRKKKEVKSSKIKHWKVWSHHTKSSLNTGHMKVQPEPTLPLRDAMSALWEGQFKQCIELFSRREIQSNGVVKLWLVWRQNTYLFMLEDCVRQQRQFSIFFGSEDRAMSRLDNIPWSKYITMDDTKVEHDRTVQAPRLWRIGRNRA